MVKVLLNLSLCSSPFLCVWGATAEEVMFGVDVHTFWDTPGSWRNRALPRGKAVVRHAGSRGGGIAGTKERASIQHPVLTRSGVKTNS